MTGPAAGVDVDAAPMAAVANLPDAFGAYRPAGPAWHRPRVGEPLDLELNAVIDYGPTGTWLRVPIGKLGTERSVPLDAPTFDVLDRWLPAAARTAHPASAHRQSHRLLSPSTPPPGATCLRTDCLPPSPPPDLRARREGLDRHPAPVAAHPRHDAGNAGMSLQAPWHLPGHVTPR